MRLLVAKGKTITRSIRKFRSKNTFSFLLITCFLMLFYTLMVYEATGLGKIILFAAVLLFADGLKVVWTSLYHDKEKTMKGLEEIVAVSLGAIVTFIISIQGLGPVFAAAVIGLFYSTTADRMGQDLKGLSPAVYCGAFVGMSFVPAFTQLWMVALAGFAAGLAYFVSDCVFDGVGGKLGTIAFIGSVGIKMLLVLI
jgi:hypothetical protein